MILKQQQHTRALGWSLWFEPLIIACGVLIAFAVTSEAAPQNQGLRTSQCRLNVNQAGRVSDQTPQFDFYYFSDGVSDPGHLSDGSIVVGNSADDLSWLIFEGSGGGPTGSNPFGYLQEQSPNTAVDSTSFSSYRIATGSGLNSDGTLKFDVSYYAPKHPDSSQFFLAYFTFSKGPTDPTGTMTGITFAFAADWNIPSDVATMNTTGIDLEKGLLYTQGTSSQTNRFGAINAFRDDGQPIVGGFVFDNAIHVDPLNTFENDDLWSSMEALAPGQLSAEAGTADFSTVLVIARDITINGATNDEFSFCVHLLANGALGSPDKDPGDALSLAGLKATQDKAVKFMCNHVTSMPLVCNCDLFPPGDVNENGGITISDLSFLTAYLCLGGAAPPHSWTADVDGDCDIDSCDIAYLGAYLFSSGPPPVECACEDPVVIGCSCGEDICSNSTTDPVLLICPAGDEQFRVYLKDQDGMPIEGDSSVYLVFNDCEGLISCPPSAPITAVYPGAPSDANGVLTFWVAGGGCNTNCEVAVTAPCGIIATVPVRMFDTNGDLGVAMSIDLLVPPDECNNYNGIPGIQVADQARFLQHVPHYCGLDPCDRFQAEFYLEPDYNLVPGDIIDLKLVLKNNNFDECEIGFISFLGSGFGTGGGATLFNNYPYFQTMPAGSEDTVTIQYTVPGIGHGCLDVQFVTSCCETAVELTQCATSTWHCAADAGLCYELNIRLDGDTVNSITFLEDFPSLGWFVDPIHVPSVPVEGLDSIVYRICTPEVGVLGEAAYVTVVVEYDDASITTFSSKVFITKRSGDVNGNCLVTISDVVYLIAYIFSGGPPPIPCESGDVNCSDSITVSDVVHLINFIFGGGPPPCDATGNSTFTCLGK